MELFLVCDYTRSTYYLGVGLHATLNSTPFFSSPRCVMYHSPSPEILSKPSQKNTIGTQVLRVMQISACCLMANGTTLSQYRPPAAAFRRNTSRPFQC